MLIYVAGPYSAPDDAGRLANTERAMAAGAELLVRGHEPLIPHLSHYFDLWYERTYGSRLDPDTYYAWDLVMLRRCDALLYLGSSYGADLELAEAEARGLPVYRSVEDVSPAWETP